MSAAEQSKQLAADAGAAISWGGFFLSHLEQINGVLQTILLLVSIAAGCVAIRYHLSKTRHE